MSEQDECPRASANRLRGAEREYADGIAAKHRKIDSEEEFRVLLKKHGFEYHGD